MYTAHVHALTSMQYLIYSEWPWNLKYIYYDWAYNQGIWPTQYFELKNVLGYSWGGLAVEAIQYCIYNTHKPVQSLSGYDWVGTWMVSDPQALLCAPPNVLVYLETCNLPISSEDETLLSLHLAQQGCSQCLLGVGSTRTKKLE